MRTQRRRVAAFAAAVMLATPMAVDLLTGTARADHKYYDADGVRITEFHDVVEVGAAEEIPVASVVEEPAVDTGETPPEYVANETNYAFYAARGYSGAMAENMAALRRCESTDDYGINNGNGYYGAYQFSASTWSWLGYGGLPHHAAPQVQDEAALALYELYGWSPWPGCSWWLGL